MLFVTITVERESHYVKFSCLLLESPNRLFNTFLNEAVSLFSSLTLKGILNIFLEGYFIFGPHKQLAFDYSFK